ncbi:MAG: type II toxin-antitoxin system RelE/ParE family toxin [Gemmatimonadetes bacterium]|nr:type II toxin-antitoxin system RelE/ParE family toxin [Gemmatimonadota bacterium]
MKRVTLSPAAAQDLADIAAHVAADRPSAVNGVLDALESACRLVAQYPSAGRARDEIDVGVRSFPIGAYVLFYYPSAQGIGIARILHARRDVTTALEAD